jgi:elongation factor P
MRLRDIKKGEAIKFRDEVWVVVDRTEVTRGNWATNWQVKLKNLMKGNIIEQRFAPVEDVEQIDLVRQEYEYLYDDGTSYVFMDPSSYEQINVSRDCIEEEKRGYLVPNMKMNLLSIDDKVLQVEFPLTVEITVTDAPEAARGDTATAVTKLAITETGGEVRVPGHIRAGDKIKIRVETGEFLGRV